MGSEAFRIEEAPVRDVAVDGFWIDSHDVTNAQFERFVRETGCHPRRTAQRQLTSRCVRVHRA
jgi:formylglycine-generating enzyme required for sulfatase activity